MRFLYHDFAFLAFIVKLNSVLQQVPEGLVCQEVSRFYRFNEIHQLHMTLSMRNLISQKANLELNKLYMIT